MPKVFLLSALRSLRSLRPLRSTTVAPVARSLQSTRPSGRSGRPVAPVARSLRSSGRSGDPDQSEHSGPDEGTNAHQGSLGDHAAQQDQNTRLEEDKTETQKELQTDPHKDDEILDDNLSEKWVPSPIPLNEGQQEFSEDDSVIDFGHESDPENSDTKKELTNQEDTQGPEDPTLKERPQASSSAGASSLQTSLKEPHPMDPPAPKATPSAPKVAQPTPKTSRAPSKTAAPKTSETRGRPPSKIQNTSTRTLSISSHNSLELRLGADGKGHAKLE